MDKALCSVGGCDRPQKARTYCSLHYKRWMIHGTTNPTGEPNCLWCGAVIVGRESRAKYCSPAHKKLASGARFRERNPGYYKRYAQCERFVQWRKDHAARIRGNNRDWARRNPEKAAEKSRRWRVANRAALQLRERNRKALKTENQGSVNVSERDWLRLCRRYDMRCAYCSVRPKVLHMDHVFPLAKGGRHGIGNILPACQSCNSSKHSRFLIDWKYRKAYRLIDEVLAAGEEHEHWRTLIPA